MSYTRMFGTVGGSRTRRGARFELAASSCCATTVCGTLAAIRTRGLLRRRQTLYPSELQGHMETAGGVEPPFTGLQPVASPLGYAVKWSSEQESNPRQTAYKAAALPSELPEHWSEWGDLNALPRGPRPRALPDELHPDMELDIGFEPITSALRWPRSAFLS